MSDVRTNYWTMDADGSNKRCLTFFNGPASPDYIPGGVTAADFAWSPDGPKLAGVLIENVKTAASRIVEIEFGEAE